jgi:hypothetical protein
MITFDDSDTYSSALSINSTGALAAVIDYLQHQDLGDAGATVAFTANIGGGAHTFVFTQGDDAGTPDQDVLVDLVGVTASSLSNTNAATSSLLHVH